MYANKQFPVSYRYIPLTGGLVFSALGFFLGILGFYAYWCGILPQFLFANTRQISLLAAFLAIPVSTSLFALGGIAISYLYARQLKKDYRQKKHK